MKKILLAFLLMLGLMSFATLATNVAFADPTEQACKEHPESAYCTSISTPTDDNTITKTISDVSKIVATVGGIAAVFLVIYGGFRYIISQGDPQKTYSARMTIIYALVGLVVIALAEAIILLVINVVT